MSDREGERCGRCSNRYVVVWAAENDLWNEVEGGPSGMRCPQCFVLDCEARGIYPFFVAFREHVNIESLRKGPGVIRLSDHPRGEG